MYKKTQKQVTRPNPLHQVGEVAPGTLKVAALGRPFKLGMLYDASKDELIPGLTLWDHTTLQKKITESSQHSSAFNISGTDSTEIKSTLLEVDASLKVSLLSGLAEVGGSAKYLKDTKKFKNQSRVVFQYKSTTNFKALPLTYLKTMDSHQIDVIKKGSATHVVTGIIYGANAFFVFDNEKTGDSSVQQIQSSMEAVIKKIPSFNVGGKVKIKLTDEEKAVADKFSCKFFGDLILESNPATFEEAVKTYAELPKLLGKNGENAVPVKVWLMPLKALCSEAPKLVTGISTGLVRKLQDALEELRDIGMRCNDSLENSVVKNFPLIEEELSTFQKRCEVYDSYLQKAIAKKLPSIRRGKENESSALQLLKDRNTSPYSQEKLDKWLNDKEREINVIRSCVEAMDGIKIVSNKTELDKEVLDPDVDEVWCFVFTSLGGPDPVLDEMAEYLDSSKIKRTTKEKWYFSDQVISKMRKQAKDFYKYAKAQKKNPKTRFLVASIRNEKYTGATIYHYENGILAAEGCSMPELSDLEKFKELCL